MKVAYLLDSAADISIQEAKELGVHVLRMPLMIEGKEFKEATDISEEQIIELMRNGKHIKTSQPILGELVDMWEELLKDHDYVFYLPLQRALSGTCATALNYAKQYDGRVVVVDSNFVSGPAVVVMKMAMDMIENYNYTPEQVKTKIEEECEMVAILIPETVETLKLGGRIKPAAAALAGMLKIVPLLKVDKEGIDVVSKVRTLKKAYLEGIRIITSDVNVDDYTWLIINIDNETGAKELLPLLEEATNSNVEERTFKAVISSHTGPGTIGFGRIKKINYK